METKAGDNYYAKRSFKIIPRKGKNEQGLWRWCSKAVSSLKKKILSFSNF